LNFLIDASLPRSTKAVIESLGHVASDVRDVLSFDAPDSAVAALALKEDRVIL
jgi:predicted nuclease of predicted toxin-antitoxin system